ncbi:MAG: glutamine synthetase type III, partial [Clostridiales bacterium]|nr:glutamine synthetase type III [Clostridiales bacterium]
ALLPQAQAPEIGLLEQLDKALADIMASADSLAEALAAINPSDSWIGQTRVYADIVIPSMDSLRHAADGAELITAKKHWPFPTYGDLLYSVG